MPRSTRRTNATKTEVLLNRFLSVASRIKKPYAIGGALAMAAYGYSRETKDVDAFVDYDDRVTWIRALRDSGLEVRQVFHGVHYVATLPRERDPDARIDLLVPSDEPEVSAVLAPDEATILGRDAVSIFPLNLLVIAKFQSERDKDHGDVDEMYERGLFNPEEVRRIIEHFDLELAERFHKEYGP